MKNTRVFRIIGFIMLALTISMVYARVNVTEQKVIKTTAFIDVDTYVNDLLEKHDKNEILVVLDIDNTLLTSTIDLGGDVWYQWQRGKLNLKPTDDQKVDCLFEDVIGLLYELGPMELTEPNVPNLIKDWQSKGIATFALTSRSPKYRAATERELLRHEINFTKTAIRPQGEDLPVYRYALDRELSYGNGILMTTGMNKGEMLEHILQKTGRKFQHIVFVDDSEKNVANIEKHFEGGHQNISIFFYDKVIADRKQANGGEVLTPAQVDKMDADWKKLNATLLEVFPGREVEGCLGSN